MGFLRNRKLILLLLIISASLLSTSSAGRGSEFLMSDSAEHLDGAYKVESTMKADESTDEITVHERLLRINTHDYGRNNPSPRLHRPRHKLIPN